MRSPLLLVSLLLLLAGGCALRVKAVFEPTGLHGATASRSRIVTSPAEVQVFIRTSPDGFTLANNELEVQNGYSHKILGTVTVKYDGGECNFGPAGRRDLIAAMQESAWSAGGNAVIYASTAWDEDTTGSSRCQESALDQQIFASGWVVAMANAAPGPP